ncbi:hypothetical protein [Flavobacterium laiguense]|uniref:DUF4369 domain-containing protein n=1 Tax=Flavobacterium laiguense TaxID=2169409 RepID=A0A2U1JQ10_9FLAO|nr:hypothetical protein [Flavobacterium laiguense]PWA07095.1 hypothetical protein DB891_14765 [Flavobacterium laiguense]
MKTVLFSIYALLFFFNANGQTKNDVLFQAKIENRNWDHLYIKDTDYNTVQIIDINNAGFFKDTLSVQDGLYLLFDGTEYFKIYLKKGYDLQVTMDANNFRETIQYTGIGSDVNNFLAKESAIEVDYDYGKISAIKKSKKIDKIIAEKENASIKRLKANTTFDQDFIALELSAYKSHTDELKKYFGELREIN